jgi:hypothetical protein
MKKTLNKITILLSTLSITFSFGCNVMQNTHNQNNEYKKGVFLTSEPITQTQISNAIPIARSFNIKSNITPNTTINGITSYAGKHFYTFSGKKGQSVTIEMRGNFDTFLELRNNSGTLITQDDDSLGNLQSRILNFSLPYDGTYIILARGFSSADYGKYSLSINSNNSVPSNVLSAFEQAEITAGSGLGNKTSNIIPTYDNNGYYRTYSGSNGAGEGIIIYKNSVNKAFWVHGGIYSKLLKLGSLFSLGFPTSNEKIGLTSPITKHRSVYQTFDSNSEPSIQYNLNTNTPYLMLKGIRNFWMNNQYKLGLPTSDELNNPVRQNFEGGTVYWNNGNPSIGNSNYFGNALSGKDTEKCCYNNRDIGAAGGNGRHLGQDLIARAGDSVYSIADGIIKVANTSSSGYGTVVVIEHTLPDSSKILSIYGHLSKSRGLNVKVNQKVTKGTLLGFIGNDNENGDGAEHLHLGIKLGSWSSNSIDTYIYPGYCLTGRNQIYSNSGYNGLCSSYNGKFVRAFDFIEKVNMSGQNPYFNQSK